MSLLLGSIIGALLQAAGSLVGRILISLGIGYATYTGIDASITFARDFLLTKIGAVGGTAVQVAGVMQIGTAISILTSALVARMTIKGLTSGALTRFKVG